MLAAEAKPFLKPDGKIMLEFGDGQADAIRKIFENEKWIVEAVKEDYSHRARILIAKCSSQSLIVESPKTSDGRADHAARLQNIFMESFLIKGGVPLHGEVDHQRQQKRRAAHHGGDVAYRTNRASSGACRI